MSTGLRDQLKEWMKIPIWERKEKVHENLGGVFAAEITKHEDVEKVASPTRQTYLEQG